MKKIESKILFGVSGLSGVVAGLLLLLFWVFHGLKFSMDVVESMTLADFDGTWITVNLMGMLSAFFCLLFFVGLFSKNSNQMPVIGVVGFVLVTMGHMFFFTLNFLNTFLLPQLTVIAGQNVKLIYSGLKENTLAGTGFISGYVVFTLGVILFTSALIKKKKYPEWMLGSMMIGAALSSLGDFAGSYAMIVKTIGIIMYAIGNLGLGAMVFISSIKWKKVNSDKEEEDKAAARD